MGRMIDTDELIDILGFENTQEEREENVGEIITLEDIDRITTAYDPDKVVEQLEKKIQTHARCIEYENKNGTITEEFQQRKAVEVLKEAIEIVKGGGVDAKTDS